MRAVMRFVSSVRVNDARIDFDRQLEDLLRSVGWWPAHPQDHPEVVAQREAILNTVAGTDNPNVRQQYKYTIHQPRPTVASWGIVTLPPRTGGAAFRPVEIRIRNDDLELLQSACANLLSGLEKFRRTGADFKLTIDHAATEPDVEVYQAGTDKIIFDALILEKGKQRRTYVFSVRRREFQFAIVMFALAMLFLVLTMPPITQWVSEILDRGMSPRVAEVWAEWISGALGRVATAALFASLVSLLTILHAMVELQQEEIVLHWRPVPSEAESRVSTP